MIDIIRAFEGLYDESILLAGTVNPLNIDLPEKVKIHYLAKYNRNSKFQKAISWIISFIQIIWIIKTKYKNAFLFIVTNPPLTIFIPFFCKNKYSLLFYDIYPDALTNLGFLNKSSLFVRIWQNANKIILKKASRIVTISEGMRKLLEQYSCDRTVDVIPIWTHNNFFKTNPRHQNIFLAEHALSGKFIVLYSGNLGYSHDVDVIIDLAEILQNKDIFFLIIGRGEKYDSISLEISRRSLNNCMILPLQPSNILPYSFSAADVAIVTLSKNASNLSLPSKTYNYLSAGAPLLCIAASDSELGNLVSSYNIGRCFSKNQINEMTEYILKLKNNSQYYSLLKTNAYSTSLLFDVDNALSFLPNV